MRIDEQRLEGVAVFRLEGKVTIGGGAVELRDALFAALEDGYKLLIVDLGGVRSIDSSGLGELFGMYVTARNKGGKLVLASIPQKVHDILQITQLITVFDLFGDSDEALAALAQEAGGGGDTCSQ